MTPPEIMCPPPPPPPTLNTKSTVNGHGDIVDKTDLLQAIRNGTTLKKTPKEKPVEITSNGTYQINGRLNGNSVEEPAINGMDKIQKELSEHFRAKENGTLPRKTPAMQPIVKRLLTEKPTESARKDDTERLMLSHGKRNFVVKKSSAPSSREETPERKLCAEKDIEIPEPEVKPEMLSRDCVDDCGVKEIPAKEVPVEVVEKKIPALLKPLKMPIKDDSVQLIKSPDITKIIKTPTTPKSPQSKLKITHGKPNYTLPGRTKNTQNKSERPTAEFLAIKLREVPNSPLQEAPQVVVPCVDTANLPPFRSATLGRKKDDLLPSPMVPAAPTYDPPKYDQKLVVSFAMDLAATPNRYPDRVKVTSTRTSPELPEDLAEMRQKKFTIDLNRLSVRQE